MSIMKRFSASFIIFHTLMVYTNGQIRPPNWDQRRFGPRNDFFGQDSGNDSDAGRRNFFGNDFQPGEMFPRRSSPGGNEARRQIPSQVPPPMGQNPVGGIGQVPPSMGQNPGQMTPIGGAGPENNGQALPLPQTPPPMGQNPDQMRPVGGMDPQNEAPSLQPPELDRIGPGMDQGPLAPGQEEVAAPQRPPPGQMGGAGDQGSFTGFGPQSPTVEPSPIIPDPREFRDRGMGQPPTPGQTELLNPRQPPMAQPPNVAGRGGEGLPPVNRGIPPQPGMVTGGAEVPQPPTIPETPGLIPEQDMGPPGGVFGDPETLGGSQSPERQQGGLGRQQRPRGVGPNPTGFGGQPGRRPIGERQGNTYNRPPRFQMSK